VDVWGAAKLVLDHALGDQVKWLALAVANGTAPEAFLLRHYRKRVLLRVAEDPAAAGAPAAATGPPRRGLEHDLAAGLDADAAHRASVELLQHTMTVHKVFWDVSRLLFEKPANPADNLEPEVIFYVEYLLRAWFVGVDYEAKGVAWAAAWRTRFLHYARLSEAELDEGVFEECCALLRVSLDKAVSCLVRMDGMLNIAFQKLRASPERFLEPESGTDTPLLRSSTVCDHLNVFSWLRSLLPPAALREHLPLTSKQFMKLEAYYVPVW